MPVPLTRGPRCERGAGEALARFSCALLLALLVRCASGTEDGAGSTHCPSVNFSVPKGSSGRILANVSRNRSLILFHRYDSILAIIDMELKFYNSTYKGHFSIVENNLFIENTSKCLAGEYHLAALMSNVCVHQIFLSVPDPWHCPSANFSIPEGSSGMIMPNISVHSKRLALYKQNHFSSSGQYILSIAKGHLNHSVCPFEEHFYLSDSGLAIKNAYEGLTGEYRLVYWQNKSCVLQFFLNIPVSGRSHVYAFPAVGFVGTLVLVFLVYLCWKQKRKDNRTAQPAHGSANGTLLLLTNIEESTADPPRRENGNSLPQE